MKAIILAAGRGSRLGKYTENIPKGLLRLTNKTILEIQIENFRSLGITDISIVKGYKGEAIQFNGIKYYWNEDYDGTNMVVSLLKAAPEFNDDIIVSYADVVFDVKWLKQIVESSSDAAILVDRKWKQYWYMRYGTTNYDLESLIINELGNIVEIGRPNISEREMASRYIGLLKFSNKQLQNILAITSEANKMYSNIPWKYSGKPFSKAYMTDLIQALIDTGIEIRAEQVENGWLEFDSESDYENALIWISDGRIKELFSDNNLFFNKALRGFKNDDRNH